MSIIWLNSGGFILCHSSFLHDLYNSINRCTPCQNCGKYAIFHISHHYARRNIQKNAPISKTIYEESIDGDVDNESVRVRKLFVKFKDEADRQQKWFNKSCNVNNSNNDIAVHAARNILRRTEHTKNFRRFHGSNVNPYPTFIEFENEKYLIPPNCTFYCCDVFEIRDKLSTTALSRFDVVIMDPPWRNKHVRRKNANAPHEGYNLIHEFNLTNLPVDDLLTADGLLIVWCTNSKQQVKYLIREMFPVWNVDFIATWYWIKVTAAGETVCKFSNNYGRKQPYERIIFACRSNRSKKYRNPDVDKLIVSIPSSIHSHKPSLSNVLGDYIPSEARCLELFARYLIPGWVSCGEEVLKLQHYSVFE